MNKNTLNNKVIFLYIILLFAPFFINAVFFDYRMARVYDNLFLLVQLCLVLYIIFPYISDDKLEIIKDEKLRKAVNTSLLIVSYSIVSLFIRTFIQQFNLAIEFKNFTTVGLNQFIFFVFVFTLKRYKDISYNLKESLFKLLITISLLTIMYNIIFKFNEFYKFSQPNFSSTLNFRSIFTNRNNFGFYMFISLVQLTVVYNRLKKSKQRIFFYITYILHVIFLFLSMSRNSLLVYLIFMVFYYLYNHISSIKLKLINTVKNKKMNFSIYIFLMLVMVLVVLNNHLVRSFLRLDNIFSFRLDIWDYSFDVFKSYPMLGVNEYNMRTLLSGYFGRAIQPHNFYISTLLSYGIIGTFVVGYQLYFYISNLIIIKNNNKVIIPFVISLAVYGIFESITIIGFTLFPILIFITFIII